MSDELKTQPMQADGQDSPKRRPDGTAPDARGRGPGGESGGGAYSDGGGRAAAEQDAPAPKAEG